MGERSKAAMVNQPGKANRSDVAELLVESLWLDSAKNKTFEVINEAEEDQESLAQYYGKLSH